MVSNFYLFHGQCKKNTSIQCFLLNVVDKYDLFKPGFVFCVYTNEQLGIHGLHFSECKALLKQSSLNCTTIGFSNWSSLQLVFILYFILHGSMTLHPKFISFIVISSSFEFVLCFIISFTVISLHATQWLREI